MGSAIIRGVIVRVDGQLVNDWAQALEKILGTGSEGDCVELPERLGHLGLRYGEVGGFDAAAPEGGDGDDGRVRDREGGDGKVG